MEGSLYKYWIKYNITLKKQSQCKYDTVSANIVIYQRRKVTSVTLHHRPQLPFIECLVLTVEAKAGLRLFWEPWPEQRQIEKGTFAMKHTLSVSLSLNWRKAPPLHRNTASFCPSVSVSLRWGRHLFAKKASLENYHWNTEFLSHSNIYLVYILTLIYINRWERHPFSYNIKDRFWNIYSVRLVNFLVVALFQYCKHFKHLMFLAKSPNCPFSNNKQQIQVGAVFYWTTIGDVATMQWCKHLADLAPLPDHCVCASSTLALFHWQPLSILRLSINRYF